MSQAARRTAERILAEADIRIGGDRPWDLHVHEPKFFARVLAEGSLGFGESYMDGWWDCEDLGGMTTRAFTARLEHQVKWSATTLFAVLHSRLLNRQKKTRAVRSGGLPYRFGDDLFEAMLDPRLCYSCAYFGNSDGQDRDDLALAQEQKLDLVCRKVGLGDGDRVLDIGCGWGSFAGFAAERYGARVLGVNVSEDQLRLGRQKTAHLEDVELRFMDYRDLASSAEIDRPFDHVVSIGMFEHVGVKNYRDFFRVAAECVDDDGLFLLHTIGRNHSVRTLEPWIDKYVFPNCQLPSAKQISAAVEGIFVIEDWHNFGDHYATTLEHWWRRFDAAWPQLKGPRYDERFYRMWRFYLLGCVGRFRARRNQLWHIVLSKRGVP
ncbi:MAG: cyclopropane fatty acyl phospholipid synthase, partial [Acidobacteriota bacterium]